MNTSTLSQVGSDTYVRLSFKFRRRHEAPGIFDLMKAAYFDRSAEAKEVLLEKVVAWLREDFGGYQLEVPPEAIFQAILNRVCDVAGHCWVSCVEIPSGDEVKALAEYLPALSEIGASIDGMVEWRKLTADGLWPYFDLLMRPNAKVVDNTGGALGAVPGRADYLDATELSGMPASWTADRAAPIDSPPWAARNVEEATIESRSRSQWYSYTPQCYEFADNCLTWASKLLDRIAQSNWFADFECCWGCSASDHSKLEKAVRSTGRMSIVERHATRQC